MTGFLGHEGVGRPSGMPAITKGMDFIGKTNSAVDMLLPMMGELDSLSGTSSMGCSSGGSVASVEVDRRRRTWVHTAKTTFQ